MRARKRPWSERSTRRWASRSPLNKVWESQADDGRFRLHWWTATETGNGTIVPDPGEVSEVRWVTPAEFLTMTPHFEADREFFERVLPGL